MTERRRRARLDTAWSEFVPVMWLMAALLATNVALVIHWRVTGDASPWSDVVGTSINATLVLGFVRHERQSVVPALRLSGVGLRGWLLGFGLLLVTGLLVEAWFFVGRQLFDTIDMLASFRDHGWPPWTAVLLIVVCPAIFEELAFRGFLLERLTPLLGRRDALLLQATLFAILHMSVVILPSHFLLGLAFGLMRVRTGSLVSGMVAHGAWNTYALIGDGLLDGW